MTNNDILRRLRYAFDINDSKMIALFALADLAVSREQVSDWLKKDDDPAYKLCNDTQLATFLNGFIHDKRGKKEGSQQEPEQRLSNNIILRKLRIALNLKDDAMIQLLSLVKYTVSKHELSAFFRRSDHRQYRECKDQILRNFLHGLQMKYRPDAPLKAATKAMAGDQQGAAKVSPAKHTKTAAKKGANTDFKWSADRPSIQPKAEKKEAATAATNKDGKIAFKWNADYQASKPRSD
ncbi:MAG: DUF1456 family protein [Mariprofundaceae bacterium]|nr:DUF1456 family protein [Mariprofundaceae bacterium]